MGRKRKSEDEKQSKKIVIYTTEERKNQFRSVAEESQFSESDLGDQIIESWLNQKGGVDVEYPTAQFHGDLTGPLRGAELLMERTVDVPFSCKLETDEGVEKWDGAVTRFVSHGSHYECQVQARGSGFKVIAGPTLSGWFLALPVHEVCLDLADPGDLFYNKEKALSVSGLNRIDGISAVYALRALYGADMIDPVGDD
ncbi:hypothetical protein [Alicyclobacillus mengziensis]|uniref:Uncharacterized protein n=1 Tax=Alicyclobacillus mengziensis TaxID=2931921 RepID=A0A9X7W3T2_9BACL|nr:hypothetical protein [Alicyclobacillus mengziensis]QSO50124.1 hypothetical protein JZ786_24470 [Alicyclobacillus mengziensis]